MIDHLKALKAKGYEVAKADNTDPESYKPALQGAYGAFVNTDCESPTSPFGEMM